MSSRVSVNKNDLLKSSRVKEFKGSEKMQIKASSHTPFILPLFSFLSEPVDPSTLQPVNSARVDLFNPSTLLPFNKDYFNA